MYYYNNLIHLFSYYKCKTFFFKSNPRKLDVSELVHSPDQISSTFNTNNEENCDEHLWVKFNIEQSAFYRFNYLAAQLRKAIVINCRDR